jgi:twitching motility protein PilI
VTTNTANRRTGLREFQEALSRRIAAAASTVREDVRLGVRSANRYWLVNLPDAGEIIPIPPLTPVPLTRPWFRGMANVRGSLYAVVDLGQFLGEAPTPPQQHARLMLSGRRYGINAALVVERVLGLRYLRNLVAAQGKPTATWVAAEYTDAEGRKWHELDVAALLDSPEFLEVAA